MRQLRHLIQGISPSFKVEHLKVSHVYWAFKIYPPMLVWKRKRMRYNVVDPSFKKNAEGFLYMCRREKSLRALHYGCLDVPFAASPSALPNTLLWAWWEVQGRESDITPSEFLQGVSVFRPKARPEVRSAMLWWLLGMREEAVIELLALTGFRVSDEEALYRAFVDELPCTDSFRWWLINPDIRGYEHIKRKDRLMHKPYIKAQLRAGKSFTGAPRESYGYWGVTFYNINLKRWWLRNRVSYPHRRLRNYHRRKAPPWWA